MTFRPLEKKTEKKTKKYRARISVVAGEPNLEEAICFAGYGLIAMLEAERMRRMGGPTKASNDE